jgi:hypothetical protein
LTRSSSTANSSPPNRETVSHPRVAFSRVDATRCSTRSPAACPCVSLMVFEVIEVDEQHDRCAPPLVPPGTSAWSTRSLKESRGSRARSASHGRPGGAAPPRAAFRSEMSCTTAVRPRERSPRRGTTGARPNAVPRQGARNRASRGWNCLLASEPTSATSVDDRSRRPRRRQNSRDRPPQNSENERPRKRSNAELQSTILEC